MFGIQPIKGECEAAHPETMHRAHGVRGIDFISKSIASLLNYDKSTVCSLYVQQLYYSGKQNTAHRSMLFIVVKLQTKIPEL